MEIRLKNPEFPEMENNGCIVLNKKHSILKCFRFCGNRTNMTVCTAHRRFIFINGEKGSGKELFLPVSVYELRLNYQNWSIFSASAFTAVINMCTLRLSLVLRFCEIAANILSILS